MSIFTDRPGEDSSQSLLNAITEAMAPKSSGSQARIAKDSFVIPSVGPHKGMRHKVTGLHEDGTMSIVPWDLHPTKVKYRLGAARATHDQLEAVTEGAPLPGSDAAKTLAAYGDMTKPYKDAAEKKDKKKLVKEDEQLEEGNAQPYVKEHMDNGVHTGWKASNKHGKVKFFGKAFKASAHKHAGIEA